jgi:hypothetical protein
VVILIVRLHHVECPCRYVVYEDEYDEAIAKGLPLPRCFALMPRVLSREEWIEKYSPKQDGESR